MDVVVVDVQGDVREQLRLKVEVEDEETEWLVDRRHRTKVELRGGQQVVGIVGAVADSNAGEKERRDLHYAGGAPRPLPGGNRPSTFPQLKLTIQ